MIYVRLKADVSVDNKSVTHRIKLFGVFKFSGQTKVSPLSKFCFNVICNNLHNTSEAGTGVT